MKVKKASDNPIKYKGKSHKIKDLIKKLNVSGDISISRNKTWFSDTMANLEKDKK